MSAGSARRVFLAVFPPPPALEQIETLQRELEPGLDDVRWTRPEQWHVTLRFLGDQPEAAVARARVVLEQLAPTVRPFTLELRGVGVFPGAHRPRVLWLGCGDGVRRLEALARELERRLVAAGFEAEPRSFRPHLTLGRWRTGRDGRNPDPPASVDGLEAHGRVTGFTVDAVSLVESRLGRGGARYATIRTAALGNHASGDGGNARV